MSIKKQLNDNRYSVNIEYNGFNHKEPIKGLKQGQQYVARFCGEYLSGHNSERYANWTCV